MGAFCCCPCSEEFEEYAHPSSSICGQCVCLRYFFHQLFTGYTSMLQRLEGWSVVPPIQGSTPLSTTALGPALSSSSLSDTYHPVPRPLPYDAESRYSRLQRDGLVSRREKSLTHFQEESQPLRRNSSSSGVDHVAVGKKWNGLDSEEGCRAVHSDSSEMDLASKASQGITYMISAEDEDVCPTCLEEYTPENPKIIMRCSHHFHLSCIYEWMERSENCPLCGKEMEFYESP